jgi:hypothetical protein
MCLHNDWCDDSGGMLGHFQKEFLHPIGIMKFLTFEKTVKISRQLTLFHLFYGKNNKSVWT